MGSSDAEARRYHRCQLLLSVATFALTIAVLSSWLWSGAAHALASGLANRLESRPAIVAAMVAAVGASTAAITFPLDLLRGFVLPRRAGLLSQRLSGWLADKGKAAALGGLLGLGVFELVYVLLAWTPHWWWVWSAAALGTGGVLLTVVAPVWIVPLFYRLRPLMDAALRERLLELARRTGVVATAVCVADFSRRGRTANAAVVGLGRTRRILISDTLLSGFPPEEVEVVLAHELVHHARGHLTQGLIVQGVVLFLTLGLTHAALVPSAPPLGLAGPADPAGMPLLVIFLLGLGLVTTPVGAAWSRRLERDADLGALEVTRTPEAFVAAMERLAQLNLAERRPHRLRTMLFATHPCLEDRIALARAAAHRLAHTT